MEVVVAGDARNEARLAETCGGGGVGVGGGRLGARGVRGEEVEVEIEVEVWLVEARAINELRMFEEETPGEAAEQALSGVENALRDDVGPKATSVTGFSEG